MNCLFLLAAILPAVLCGDDPTKICTPDKFEFNIYNAGVDASFHVAIDHTSGLMGTKGEDFHLVDDFIHSMAYSTAAGVCESYPLAAADIVHKCLPANATLAANADMGYGSAALGVEVWDIPSPDGVHLRIALQRYNGYFYPVVYQSVSVANPADSFVYIYSGIKDGNSEPLMFQVPDSCPPKSVV